jgi:hypothetical protein
MPSEAAPAAVQGSAADPDVKKSVVKLSVASLAFAAPGAANAKPIVVTETNYKGKFTAATTCGSAVTLSPKALKGPKATITVTPLAAIASCTLTVKDAKKNSAIAKISVKIPALTVNPVSLTFTATGAAFAKTFVVTQTGTGAFSETNTCAARAKVSSPSLKAPSATVTVSPTAAGSCAITIKDAYGQSKVVSVGITIPALTVNPASLGFTATGAAFAKTFAITQSGTGIFTLKNTCANVATITSTTLKAPSATVTVTPAAAGSCSITVTDAYGQTKPVPVSITVPALTVNPAELNFTATGAAYATSFAITQTGTGAFAQTNTCANIATVTSASWKAPSATATVTPVAAGTCTITVKDPYGQSKAVTVTVTTSGIIIQ